VLKPDSGTNEAKEVPWLDDPRFDWDDLKAEMNFSKHGVTFTEGLSVFENPLAVIFDDEVHSEGARPATAKERTDYEKSFNIS